MNYLSISDITEFCRQHHYPLNMTEFLRAKEDLGIDAEKIDTTGKSLYSPKNIINILNKINVPRDILEELVNG